MPRSGKAAALLRESFGASLAISGWQIGVTGRIRTDMGLRRKCSGSFEFGLVLSIIAVAIGSVIWKLKKRGFSVKCVAAEGIERAEIQSRREGV